MHRAWQQSCDYERKTKRMTETQTVTWKFWTIASSCLLPDSFFIEKKKILNLFKKMLRETWSTSYKRMKLEHFLIPYTKIDFCLLIMCFETFLNQFTSPSSFFFVDPLGFSLYDIMSSRDSFTTSSSICISFYFLLPSLLPCFLPSSPHPWTTVLAQTSSRILITYLVTDLRHKFLTLSMVDEDFS